MMWLVDRAVRRVDHELLRAAFLEGLTIQAAASRAGVSMDTAAKARLKLKAEGLLTPNHAEA